MPTPRTLHEGEFLVLRREGQWEYVDRKGCSGAVMVVATTVDDDVILIEQFRTALHAWVVEWPAGLIGDADGPNDTWEETAIRELLEETGYRVGAVEWLALGAPASGLSSETMILCRATGATKAGSGGGIGGEQIRVHTVPRAQVQAWLASQAAAGVRIDIKIFAGLYWLDHDPL